MDDFAGRLSAELHSYAPFAVPALIIYALESRASQQFWHALRFLPHLGATTSSNVRAKVDVDDARALAARRRTIDKAARFERVGCCVVSLILCAIVAAEQYFVYLRKYGDGSETMGDESHFSLYETRLETPFGTAEWTEIYGALLMFWPVVYLVARSLCLLSSHCVRVALRESSGAPFLVMRKREGSSRSYSFLILTASAVISAGVVLVRNAVSSSIFYASILHYYLSSATVIRSTSFRGHFLSMSFMTVAAYTFYLLAAVDESDDLKKYFYVLRPQEGVFWSPIISNALWSATPFHLISLCRRFDYACGKSDMDAADITFSRVSTDEMLRGCLKNHSTVIDYKDRPSCRKDNRSQNAHRCSKRPYFHAAISTYIVSWLILAALKLSYVPPEELPEGGMGILTGMALSYIMMPLSGVVLLACAFVRGEFKSMWKYREDWAYPLKEAKKNLKDLEADNRPDACDFVPASLCGNSTGVGPEETKS